MRYTRLTRPASWSLGIATGLLVVAALSAVPFADDGQTTPVVPTVLPVWPPPPAPTRVRYVRALTPGDVQRRRSTFGRVVSAIIGGGRETPAMTQPYGVAVGPDQRVYVTDSTGGVIHVYDVQRQRYTAITVKGAQSLIGIAFTGDMMVVTDAGAGNVLGLDLDGGVRWTVGRREGLQRPTGIAVGPGRLYVVDTLAHQIVVLDTQGRVVSRIGRRGDVPGEFNFPTNIARGTDGTLYVTDSMNFRVQQLEADGRPRAVFGRLGDGTGDFSKPKGIALDSEGHIYVVEGLNDLVQVFDTSGRLLLAFGGSGIAAGQFWLPTGIAIVKDQIYVVDSANHRVQQFDYLRGRS